MTLTKDVVLRAADGKLLDNIDSEQAKDLLDSGKARIVCNNPLILQMRLEKNIPLLSYIGTELRKIDMRKARKLIQTRKVKIIQKNPLVIQYIKRFDAGIETCTRSDAF